MLDQELYKIVISDAIDDSKSELMIVNGKPKVIEGADNAATFCEDLNKVAREESQTWRYIFTALNMSERAAWQALLIKDAI